MKSSDYSQRYKYNAWSWNFTIKKKRMLLYVTWSPKSGLATFVLGNEVTQNSLPFGCLNLSPYQEKEEKISFD
jgi:hypothetical protein